MSDTCSETWPTPSLVVKSIVAIWWAPKKTPWCPSSARGRMATRSPRKAWGTFHSRILEADIILRGGDRAHDLVLVVVHVRKAVEHGASAWPIAAGRHLLVKR